MGEWEAVAMSFSFSTPPVPVDQLLDVAAKARVDMLAQGYPEGTPEHTEVDELAEDALNMLHAFLDSSQINTDLMSFAVSGHATPGHVAEFGGVSESLAVSVTRYIDPSRPVAEPTPPAAEATAAVETAEPATKPLEAVEWTCECPACIKSRQAQLDTALSKVPATSPAIE